MATAPAMGRNAPCPCGSGRKVKKCHPDGFALPEARRAPAIGRVSALPAVVRNLWMTDTRTEDDVVLDAAEGCLDDGLLDDAVTAAALVMDRSPGNARALALLGAIAHRMRDPDTAADLLVRAVAADPASTDARRRLAALLDDLGLRDQATGQLEAAIAATPDDGYPYLDLAAMALRDGDAAAAESLLVRGADADPTNAQLRRRLTWLRLRDGPLEDARAAYEALLAWESAHPELVLPDPKGHRIHAGPVAGVVAWCREHGAAVTVVRPAAQLAIERPRYAPDPAGPPPEIVTRPDRYVAMLRDALVVGRETLVVAEDGTMLSDVATHPDADRYDLVRGATRYADSRRALLDLVDADPVELDRAVALTAPGSPNWYHWLLEILTRIGTLELAGGDAVTWPLLVDEAAARIPQLIEALRIVVGPDRRVVALGLRQAARVRNLAVVSPGAWLPIDLRDGLNLLARDSIIDPEAVDFLRRRLMPAGLREAQDAGMAPGTRRLFLGRSREGRMAGGAALAPVLEARAIETVLPERLTVAEQVRLVADASLIVAESGAALTNLVFAPPSTRIVVLGADRWDLTLFSQLAGHRGQQHLYVAGRPLPGSHAKVYQSRFTLDPASLAAALDAFAPVGAP